MEKMNKEQLIEWFVENYGSHPLLAQFISVTEIRKRLNENIREVTYEPEKEKNTAGGYNNENGIINIDFERCNQEQTIVHEILHALTYSKGEYSKIGLLIQKTSNHPFENIRGWSYLNSEEESIYYKEIGRGISEGITDWLAEELTGIKNSGYNREKTTVNILFGLIGKETVLEKFFDQDLIQEVTDDFTLEELFSTEIDRRYGIRGGEISTIISQLIDFQDTLTILEKVIAGNDEEFVKEYRKMHDVAKEEIVIVANDLVTVALECTGDVLLRKELLKIAVLNSNLTCMFPQTETIQKVFIEFLANQELSTEEKMEIIETINGKDVKIRLEGFEQIANFLLHSQAISEISMSYRLHQCLQIAGKENFEEFCIKEGIVNKADFSKANMINDFLKIMDLNRDIYGQVEGLKHISLVDVQYQRIGNHYELSIQNVDTKYTYLLEGRRYDKRGDEISNSYVLVGEEGEITCWGKGMETSQWKRIEEQVGRIQTQRNESLESVEIIGEDITMRFVTQDENGKSQTSREYYIIGEDGQLEVAQVGEVRRLTDDMSKLDIQLMEETAKVGVTTSQMMQVADVMKANLKVGEIEPKAPTEKGDD